MYPFQVDLLTGKLQALRVLRQGFNATQESDGGSPPAFELTYYWKDGTLANGAVLETGSTPPEVAASQFVNFATPAGSSCELAGIDGGLGGAALLGILYAYDGNSGNRLGELIVNGVAQPVTFISTTSWGVWRILLVETTLLAGTGNTIKLNSIGNDLGNALVLYVNPNRIPVAAPPPPPPSPAPPAPPPVPAGNILDSEIFAMWNTTLTFAQARGGFGCEWDNNKKAGLTGVSDTIGAGYLADNNNATGALGRNRVTKQVAPDDPLRRVLVVRGYKFDGLTSAAPRTEIGNWITTPGVIPIKQDFWFVIGVYFSQGFPITNEFVMAQWHTNGSSPAGYAGQPFFAIIVKGQNFQIQQRWNANSTLNSGNTSYQVHNVGAITSGWNYFVVKARISPLANDNPYLAMWRSQNGGALTQVINPASFPNARLGYTGFDNGDPPWQKFGHYPWGWDGANFWPDPLTRELFFRAPTYVDDTTSRYLPIDLLNFCANR